VLCTSSVRQLATLCHRTQDGWHRQAVATRPDVRQSDAVRLRCVSTSVVNSPHPDIDVNILDAPITSLAHFIINEFNKYSKRTALVDGVSGRQVSYGELETMVVKVASSLVSHGLVQKGTVVTLCSTNCIEFVVIYLAVTALGAIISPVNPSYTVYELVNSINLVQSTLLVATESLVPVARQAQQQCPTIKDLIVFGDGHSNCRPFSSLLTDDMSCFPDNVNLSVRDVVCLPFSSGTTGLPKAVMLTSYSIHANIHQIRSRYALDLQPGDECIPAVLPFYHIYGQVMLMLSGLSYGARLIILPKFQPKTFLDAVQNHRATYLMIVPPIMLFLADHALVKQTDFSSVRVVMSGAAPLGPATAERVRIQCKNQTISVRQAYGLTEASPLTHCHSPGSIKIHTVGQAIQNTQFKIADAESGEALGVEQNGEVYIRGPQVMKGYYKNEKATRESIDADGWLHTGDFGHFDEDGHLCIKDRLKELIKFKGLQVAPAELEALLITHEAVEDVAVIGRYIDERVGELPTAFVVLKPHQTVTQEELQQFVADRVTEYKRLTGGIIFCKEIPKSASGKILRRVLRDEFQHKFPT
jgi:acyl-CoA synthetase (AMP-forming)/AMP-acid ligase II